MTKHAATAEEITALKDAGYTIENVGAEYGTDFHGQYRWLNPAHEADGGDGFGMIFYNEADAWADAKNFQEQELGIPLWIPEA